MNARLLDDGDLETELPGGADAGDISARPAADDDHVVLSLFSHSGAHHMHAGDGRAPA
jgi:hypothetical protein